MNSTRPTIILLYLACYAIWLALSAGMFLLMALVRTNVLDFAYMTGGRPMLIALIDRLALIPLVITAIAVIITLEHVLRNSVPMGRLWQRARKAALIIFGACVVSYALHALVVTARLAVVP